MKETKKEKVLTIIGVMTLLLFGVGATYAYFVAQGGNAEQTGVNVLTHTTDSLVFEVGKAISITADQTSFAPGAGNRSDSTFARATLKANSSTNSATEHYYVYLAIDTNEFKYTTDTKTAELILTVHYKDTNGNVTPVTSINGLNYVTVGEVSGFDITEEQNLITIANNHEITSTGTEVDEWDITLTLVNLDSNQTANAGKNFNATLMIQKEETFAGHIMSLYTTQGANHLYHHNGTITDAEGNIMDVEDGSYRYAGGDEYDYNYDKNIIGVVESCSSATADGTCQKYEKIYYLFDDNYVASIITKYSEIITKYSLYGYNSLTDEEVDFLMQLQSEVGSGKLVSDGADGNFLYSSDYNFNGNKDNILLQFKYKEIIDGVKNFVCFGTNEKNCDDEHLYRIIGVFDNKVKLIKTYEGTEESLGTAPYKYEGHNQYYKGKSDLSPMYYYSGSNDNLINDWSKSSLNIETLNGSYLSTLGITWSNMIATNEWKFGGNNGDNIYKQTALSAYKKEIINPITNSSYTAKVGLMYASDYGFATIPNNWTNTLNNYKMDNIRDNNWLFLGIDEMLISRFANYDSTIYYVAYNGDVNWSSQAFAVRPTFYLKSTVTFAGGTGTEADPYRIA